MSLPTIIATACFLRDKGKTLFVDYSVLHNHPIHDGKHAAPGGKVEASDNSLEEAASREVLEETNIRAYNLIYRGTVLFLNEKRTINGKPMKNNWEVYFYDCHNFDATDARPKEGNLVWVNDDNVLDLPLHEGDRVLWGWMQEYQEFKGEVMHEGDKLTEKRIISGRKLNS
ncbi:MAG: NUDIX domain-containing protein [Nanoarchaeota archaeon]|nr:NUDIX domain-containing protein [Nanoarchaeota archaeon]